MRLMSLLFSCICFLALVGCGGSGGLKGLGNGFCGTGIGVGCGNGGGASPTPSPSPSSGPQEVFMDLKFVAITDPIYGVVFGYNTTSAPLAQIVHLTANAPVEFSAFTDGPHTAAYLGTATASGASWPVNCASVASCVSTTASPAGTVINTPGFTTGTVNTGLLSATYMTPGPGFYIFGCHYHYDSNGMRTVIISM